MCFGPQSGRKCERGPLVFVFGSLCVMSANGSEAFGDDSNARV